MQEEQAISHFLLSCGLDNQNPDNWGDEPEQEETLEEKQEEKQEEMQEETLEETLEGRTLVTP